MLYRQVMSDRSKLVIHNVKNEYTYLCMESLKDKVGSSATGKKFNCEHVFFFFVSIVNFFLQIHNMSFLINLAFAHATTCSCKGGVILDLAVSVKLFTLDLLFLG